MCDFVVIPLHRRAIDPAPHQRPGWSIPPSQVGGLGEHAVRRNARRIRSATLAILFGVCIVLSAVGQGQAREFEIDGTADCGLKSGKHCSVGSTLAIWTENYSGEKERVEVDVRWIKDDLDKIDQDDYVCLVVEDRDGGRLRGVGVSQTCKFDGGTINPGLSTGSKKVSEQPKRDQDDDHDNTFIPTTGTPGATPTPSGPPGTVTGIVTNALTGQPIAGATVRVDNSTASTTTDSNGRFTLNNAPSGSQTLRTTASGFVTETRTITIVAGGSLDQTISLSPIRAGSEITIVLTWGSQPLDLDAHLSGPDSVRRTVPRLFRQSLGAPAEPVRQPRRGRSRIVRSRDNHDLARSDDRQLRGGRVSVLGPQLQPRSPALTSPMAA